MIRCFKGYFISSTYAQVISNQSCITNCGTPCSIHLLAEYCKRNVTLRAQSYEGLREDTGAGKTLNYVLYLFVGHMHIQTCMQVSRHVITVGPYSGHFHEG